ncbi:MAG TPA: hypothetical protein PLN52_23330, partial [Opitutaceae bacterium]|nr:hypothetical protein [Opitutaceae bacterium]
SDPDALALTNNTNTRVRGLAEATQARNFFRSIVPMDSYNSGRIDINRGANAMLFGVGSPAGIINSTTNEANLARSRYITEVVGDNFGSHRGSLDLNQVIVPQQLAVRVSAMDDDRRFKQEPAFNHDQRIYGAVAARIKQLERGILSGTTLRAQGEWGWIEGNNPRVLPPVDQVSGWFEDTIFPEYVQAGITPKATWNGYGPYAGANQVNAMVVAKGMTRSPVAIFPDPNSPYARDPLGTVNGQTILGRPFASSNVYWPSTGTVTTGATFSTNSFAASLARQLFPDAEVYRDNTINTSSIFDYNNLLLDGVNKRENTRFRATNFAVEQLLLDGKAGIEFAVDNQRVTDTRRSLLARSSPWIAIDLTTRFWDGTVNPNFGRPFTGGHGTASSSMTSIETTRTKAFYELDLEDSDNRFVRYLGRHVFSVLNQKETYLQDERGGRFAAAASTWNNGLSPNRQSDEGSALVTANYLGSSLFNVRDPRTVGIANIQVDRYNIADLLNGQGVFLVRTPPATAAGAATTPVGYEPVSFVAAGEQMDGIAGNAFKSQRVLRSDAFATQSHFLKNHLIGTIGWRREEVETKRVAAPLVANGANYRLVSDSRYNLDDTSASRQEFGKTLMSWSAVAKSPQNWARRIPGVSAVNVFYGESENFSPPDTTAINVFGRQIAPPSGETKDYGVSVGLLDDRVTVRLVFYKTNQLNERNSAVTAAATSIVAQHLASFNSVRSGFNPDSDGDGFPDGYVPPPQELLDLYRVRVDGGTISSTNPGIVDTSDFVAEGEELEVQLRPTRGWHLTFNVARQESVRNNTGQAVHDLVYNTKLRDGSTLATAWSSNAAANIAISSGAVGVPTGSGTLKYVFENNIVRPISFARAQDGGTVSELREWRANAVAKYNFRGGLLNGWGVGGAARWEDRPAIGYRVSTFKVDGTRTTEPATGTNYRAFDPQRPIYGPEEWTFDAFLSYSRKIFQDKVALKIQLNVRNLFAEDTLIPVQSNPDGSMAVGRIQLPRTARLSAQFEF